MLELFFVIAFFLVLLVTGLSLFGILAALFLATVVMAVGGMLALFVHLLPWLLLAVVGVWIIRAIKRPKSKHYVSGRRWRY